MHFFLNTRFTRNKTRTMPAGWDRRACTNTVFFLCNGRGILYTIYTVHTRARSVNKAQRATHAPRLLNGRALLNTRWLARRARCFSVVIYLLRRTPYLLHVRSPPSAYQSRPFSVAGRVESNGGVLCRNRGKGAIAHKCVR